ncbi:hypothetical protein RND71_026926 [Anisodus tanguticus]|uniref:CSC1/OSCA1-like N-terminal transmembrane domain-containing protein n=1 Tax=Anisodus tanguticus TaxID=243964 RepID=A0AAE1RP80_9SOLA|nr:hypothetical protein RND71_026926 [Anisodus tanguticus]
MEASDEEIVAAGGLDGFVSVRMIVFSFRIFSIATTLGLFLVLPLNYFCQDIRRQEIPAESLEEYKSISRKRLEYLTSSVPHPSYFTVLVPAIPKSEEESYSHTVEKFFSNYYASSYHSHQIIYRSGSIQKLLVSLRYFLL